MTKLLDEYPDVIDADDLMAILDISRCTAYKLLRNGLIPSTKIGKQYRIHKNALVNYLFENHDYNNKSPEVIVITKGNNKAKGRAEAVRNYHKKLAVITIRIPQSDRDYKQEIINHAEKKGLSLNSYILSLIENDMGIVIPKGVKDLKE